MNSSLEQTIQHVASGATVTGGVTTVFLGLNVDQWGIAAAVAALIFTIAGFCINWYYKHRMYKKL